MDAVDGKLLNCYTKHASTPIKCKTNTMSMRLTIISLLILTLLSANAYAESVEETLAAPKFERLSSELQLSAEQKARLAEIYNEKHEKIRAIREETQERIEELLTDEQMAKWETLKKH
jgi:Skp family chaperone for outer membrane proteins